jgi:hypothetical protein
MLLSSAVLLWQPIPHAEAAATPVLAGAATVPFTLPPGVPLAGYSRRKGQPSQGLHDPVGARAVVLQQAQREVVLISADLLIIDEQLFGAVRQRLVAAGFAPDVVLWLAATHTHSGPGAYGTRFAEKISMGHFDPAVFDALVEALVQAARLARQQLVPVQIGYETVPTTGLIKNRVLETGQADEHVVVVGLYPMQAQAPPLALLVSFSAHPTALGAWNQQLSADYPGVLAAAVEQRLAGTVCLFFAGAVGDQAPVKSGDGFERAAWIGRALADQVLASVARMQPVATEPLAGQQRVVPLPRAQVRLNKRWGLPGWLSRRLVDNDATLTMWQLGPVVAFGTPCDLESTLAVQLREAAQQRGRLPFVASFVNDYIGYCVSPSRYQAGDYEALMAFNGPTTAPLLIEQLTRMLRELP